MNRNHFHSGAVVVLAALLATSCGTDGGSGVGIDGTGIFTGRDIVSVGRVRSLGAIEVNGVRYDTAAATFTIDGYAASNTALNLGDVVRVEAKLDQANNAVAQRVVAEHILQGRTSSIDTASSTFVAMGQSVKVNEGTIFGASLASGLAGLTVADSISVSGFRDIRGAIIATRVDRQVAGPAIFQTTGAVTEVASDGRYFSINNLSVDYGNAVWSPTNAATTLQRGAFVQVKGSIAAGSGVLVATSVVVKGNHLGGTAESLAHMEGYITSMERSDSTHFEINGLAVSMNSATQVAGLLSVDAQILVTGAVNTDGAVAAAQVVAPPGNPGGGPIGGVPGNPPSPPGPYVSVTGKLFDALSGPVSGATVDVWVQTPGLGYSLSVNGTNTVSLQDGKFTAVVPESALLMITTHKDGYVQPCTVMVTATEGLAFDVEVVAEATLDSINPPPPLSAAGATTVTGAVYEMVAGVRQPVAGAWLWFGDSMGLGVAYTTSDREGRFLACRMPNDPRWSTWGTELWAGKDGYHDNVIERFDTSQSQVFDLELKRR